MNMTMSARLALPVLAILIGLLLLGASALGGQPLLGLAMFAVMTIYSGVLVAFGGRNETIGVLAGRPVDERLSSFNLQAAAVAGTVGTAVAILGFLWSIAR